MITLRKYILLFIIPLFLTSCMGLGKKLGTSYKEIPVSSIGLIELETESVSVIEEEVEFSEVDFPPALWTPDAVKLAKSSVSLVELDDKVDGTITVSIIIDEHPVSAWEITVTEGKIENIDAKCGIPCSDDDLINSDATTFIPGVVREGGSSDHTIEREQLEWIRTAYSMLPEDERPAVDDDFIGIVQSGHSQSLDEKEIFRTVARGLKDKQFKLAVMAHSVDDINGQLLIQNIDFRIFDSGQGLYQ